MNKRRGRGDKKRLYGEYVGRKKMKKLFVFFLILTMLFAFAACGGDEKVDSQSEAGTSGEAGSVVGKTYELYKVDYGEEKKLKWRSYIHSRRIIQ